MLWLRKYLKKHFEYINLIIITSYPTNNNTIIPVALLSAAMGIDKYSLSMLFSRTPITLIWRSIIIFHFTKTLLLIPCITTLIIFTIRPDKLSLPMHLIVKPSSPILPAIRVFHFSLALLFVIFELPDIFVPISPFELTFAIFLIAQVFSLKCCTIKPSLTAMPGTLIILPLALVYCAIGCDVFTTAMRFISFPVTNIKIAIGVVKASFTFCLPWVKFSPIGTMVREI